MPNSVVVDQSKTGLTLPNITPELINSFLAQLHQLMTIAKLMVMMTPTQKDDEMLANAEKFLAVVEPYLANPAVPALIDFVIHLVASRPNDPSAITDALNAVKASVK